MAILALTELYFAKLRDIKNPARIDLRGAILIVAGMALSVLGIQQSTVWGWGDARTIASIVIGVLLLVVFVFAERDTENPLIDVRAMAANRPFAVDNILTLLAFAPWLAVFFFGSFYFQVAVHQEPTEAGFSILTMFYSFFVAARVGGGWMDKFGAKKPVALGFAAASVGMILWASELDGLSRSSTLAGMLVTGAGFGLVFSPLNTDALNRLPDAVRGQGSGIVQTFRNYGSALGMAIMGTIIASATDLPGAVGVNDFVDAMKTAWYVGAGMLAVGWVICQLFMPGGKQEGI